MKMAEPPRRYHGLMAMVMAIQIAKALLIVRYLGKSELMSFPAGRTFSKMQENMAE